MLFGGFRPSPPEPPPSVPIDSVVEATDKSMAFQYAVALLIAAIAWYWSLS